MRTNTKSLILILLTSGPLLAAPGSVLADNWMRSEKESYFKTSLEYDTSNERWNQDSKLVSASCTATNWKLSQSYEYGLSYYRTFFSSLDYLDRECGEYGASGVGDLTLGLRSRLDIYRNGRTWEASVVIPTGYSSSGNSSVGSGLVGLKLGVFGSFGDRQIVNGEPSSNYELGANVAVWEGHAAEQLSGYIKYNFAASKESHYFGSLEGDYALIDRKQDLSTVVNPVSDYGYDRVGARLGYSRRASLYWRVAFEATSVLWGRNASDTNSVKISFSRNFMD